MEIAILILAVLVAYIVKGLCGFANTLIFANIAAFFIDSVILTPIELLLSFPSDLIMAVRNYKKIQIKPVILLSAMVFLGTIGGTFLLIMIDASLLKIFFGVIVVILAIEMLLRNNSTKKHQQNTPLAVVIGLISGVLGGLFGTGALLVAYITRTTEDVDTFKSTLNIIYSVNNVFRIVLYISTGILTLELFQSVLWLFPFMLVGLFTGMGIAKKVSKVAVKKCIIFFLLLSGVSLVLTNIF